MHKKLVTLSLLSAIAPATVNAEVNIYGRIHASVDSVSGIAAEKNTVSVNSNGSHFGLRGGEDLDGGLKAIYQVEADMSANGNGGTLLYGIRDTYLGVSGGFGTFKVGKLPAARLYLPDTNLFRDQVGDAANFSGLGELPSRTTGTLSYALPDLAGFSALLSYIPAKSVNSSKTVTTGGNSYGVKASYAIDTLHVSATYLSFNKDKTNVNGTVQPISLGVLYDVGKVNLTAQLIRLKNETAAAESNRRIYNLGSRYALSDKTAIKAQYSNAGESSAGAADSANMLAAGWDYSLGKNTTVYAVYAVVNNNTGAKLRMNYWGHDLATTATVPALGEDPSGLSLGLTHNF